MPNTRLTPVCNCAYTDIVILKSVFTLVWTRMNWLHASGNQVVAGVICRLFVVDVSNPSFFAWLVTWFCFRNQMLLKSGNNIKTWIHHHRVVVSWGLQCFDTRLAAFWHEGCCTVMCRLVHCDVWVAILWCEGCCIVMWGLLCYDDSCSEGCCIMKWWLLCSDMRVAVRVAVSSLTCTLTGLPWLLVLLHGETAGDVFADGDSFIWASRLHK